MRDFRRINFSIYLYKWFAFTILDILAALAVMVRKFLPEDHLAREDR